MAISCGIRPVGTRASSRPLDNSTKLTLSSPLLPTSSTGPVAAAASALSACAADGPEQPSSTAAPTAAHCRFHPIIASSRRFALISAHCACLRRPLSIKTAENSTKETANARPHLLHSPDVARADHPLDARGGRRAVRDRDPRLRVDNEGRALSVDQPD